MSQYLKRIEISNVGNVEEEIQSHYLKRVHVVEVVDSDGNPWEPEPGPDPWDELVVQTDANWANLNDYSGGSEVFGYPAKFTGGNPENTTYRYCWQYKEYGDASWTSTSWTSYSNNPIEVSFVIPQSAVNGQVRLMSQALDDSTDPVTQVNSFTSIESIAPAEWESITQTIEGSLYDPNEDGSYPVAINSPIICAVNATGPDDITYEWSRRGSDPTLIGTPTAAQTAITFPEQGVFTVTTTIKSNKTAEWESAIFTFIAA